MKVLPRCTLALVPLGALVACTGSADPAVYGADPTLPEPQRGLLPSMKIAELPGGAERRLPNTADPTD